MNIWEISTSQCENDAESIMRRGNIYQLANGYMGYRGTLDEFGSKQLVGITLAGIYDRVGTAWREPVNAPNGGYTSIFLDGVELSTLDDNVVAHRQSLRLDTAMFVRETTFESKGNRVTILSTRFLSSATPNLGIIRYSVRCESDAEVTIRTGIDGDIWDLNGPHLPDLKYEKSGDVLLVAGATHESSKVVAVAEAVACVFGEESHEIRDQKNLRLITVPMEAGRNYSFDKYFSVTTENDSLDSQVTEAAIAVVKSARDLGYDACLANHEKAWECRWEKSDVVIEGDEDAQLALRYSILQLLMVAPVKGSSNSIPARALSGQVYKGAIFWDTEMFMYPFFLHTDSEKAMELLRYRIRTLDGARRKAMSEGPGYRGAFYAWESQEAGDDACSYFNVGDPITGRDLRTHFRDKQVHISGDIAIAMWSYFQHTGDDSLLLEGGAEVILECARFYFSYAYFKKDKGRYEILDVIGPDEYHERVNNNAFTSKVAKETFTIAHATVEHLRNSHPDVLRELVAKIGIEAELPDFAEAAALLYVPEPDPDTGVIEQFDGYFKLRNVSIEQLKEQKIHPNEYLGAGQGLAVPTQVIKQADVVMLLNLFKDRYDAATKQANWEYYEPRTEHGSSLSACAYAMVALEFGKMDFAYQYFLKTARIDLESKSKLYAGTIFIGGSHPAANGGAWMTAVLGFGGVQANAKGFTLRPKLYPKWKSLRFKINYQQDRFLIIVTHDSVTITAADSNVRSHDVKVVDVLVQIEPGETIAVALKSLSISNA